MANSLYPAYVVAEYQTAYGFHTMTIPTLAWDSTPAPYGTFDTHDAVGIAADTMIEALLTAIMGGYQTTEKFYRWSIFTMASPTATPLLVAAKNVTIAGDETGLGTGERSKATQQTLTLKTTLGGIFKLILLDIGITGEDDRKLAVTDLTADQQAVVAEVMDTGNGWAGRDGGRPFVFLQSSEGDNDGLRADYKMN